MESPKPKYFRMNKKYQRLGDILKKQGLISPDQLKSALKLQKESGQLLGKILTSEKNISEDELARALAFQKNIEVVELSEYEVSMHAAALVNADVATRFKALPIDFIDDELLVAVADPLDVYAIDSMKMITGLNIQTVVATESSIEDAIKSYLSGPSNIKETVEEASLAQVDPVVDSQDVDSDEGEPVVRLVNIILVKAFRERASDVHIECRKSSVSVRYRVDGVLRESMVIPHHLKSSVVSRFKIMSGMDIAERRRPQDGRMSLEIDGTGVEFRAATLPSLYGENIVLRLLTGGKTLMKLESLGMSEDMLKQCRKALAHSHGAFLVTGPTGSGKTTSLYAMINEINDPEKKIVTLEDPIESPMAGLTQLQINRKVDLDFATGLRAILRSDPDIVMVGEIRDIETARIAIRGALTGHLVLSSLHTNDAPSAMTRLIDMGLDPYLVASSIQGVVAQRLARLLCPKCKQPVKHNKDILVEMGYEDGAPNAGFYEPKGCRKCQNTGYQGRLGLFELLMIDDEIGKLCIVGASSVRIKQVAISRGMQTLLSDGLAKAAAGLIPIAEVKRVVF